MYFGNYYQSSADVKEPIKWRVLSVEGDDAFLISDMNLDCKPYNKSDVDVTWETCTLRSWLNGYGADSNVEGVDYSTDNFMDIAFTEEEQAAINITTVVNDDNPTYETEGGNNTEDKVYLLSAEEVSNEKYGFDSTYDCQSKTREVKNTDYAKLIEAYVCNVYPYVGNGYYWLRLPGYHSSYAIFVRYDGSGEDDGENVNRAIRGVRPVLHLNLSSSVWTSAGTVTSEEQSDY